MTKVYITIDTEYSSGFANGPGPVDRAENFARSIGCFTPQGPAGVPYQLETLDRHGQKGVFFVDPMPALVWGVAAIEDVVGPIREAGHDVQLHCHAEWLELAVPGGPFAGMSGHDIKDFGFEDQCRILDWARDTLVAAGAAKPVAFRAGNYGANDDTLRALAAIGIRYDSSHCPALVGKGASEIELGPDIRVPVLYEGVVEVPVGCIAATGGGLRHAQITALSLAEMVAAIEHSVETGVPSFTLVSHSFEFVNRRTFSFNRVVGRRFERLCAAIENMPEVDMATYNQTPPLGFASQPEAATVIEPLPHHPLRTGMRMAEQVISNTLYGAL